MKIKSWKENKILIALLIALVVIGSIVMNNFLSFLHIRDLIIDQIKENQDIKTKHAADSIENHIKLVQEELVTLSQFPLMETLDINSCSGNMSIVHESLEGKIDSLLRVDKQGNIVECSDPRFNDYLGLNIKNKEYFTIPKETNQPYISGITRQGESLQIIVSTPTFETVEYTPYPNFKGEFRGVLMSIIELSGLYSLYIHPMIDLEKNSFLLIDAITNETIMKSSDIGMYTEIKSELPSEFSTGEVTSNLKGFGKSIITSADLFFGDERWELIVITPLKKVRGEIAAVQKRHILSSSLIVVIIISILMLVVSLYKSKEGVVQQLDQTKVTLEKLGIKIDLESEKFTAADINLEPRKVYLIKEDEENHAHELFISSLNRGFAGLGIVRQNPQELKSKYNLHKTSFIWLTKSEVEGIPSETNINNLYALLSEFVGKSKKSAVLIDRFDYIIAENDFESVLKRLHEIKDLTSSHECIVIISLNPELISEAKLKAIEAETIDLYGKDLRKRIDLTELEAGILKFVNSKNIMNQMASYKDITHNFKITKPTTRSKVSKLQLLGLLDVEQKGRFKSIKVTSAGRK